MSPLLDDVLICHQGDILVGRFGSPLGGGSDEGCMKRVQATARELVEAKALQELGTEPIELGLGDKPQQKLPGLGFATHEFSNELERGLISHAGVGSARCCPLRSNP